MLPSLWAVAADRFHPVCALPTRKSLVSLAEQNGPEQHPGQQAEWGPALLGASQPLELVQAVQQIHCRMGTPCTFCFPGPKCAFPISSAIKCRHLKAPPVYRLWRVYYKSLSVAFQCNSALGATSQQLNSHGFRLLHNATRGAVPREAEKKKLKDE